MAMIAPDNLRQRALRAYEWGRLRHAAVKAWPALLLTAISWWLCHEPVLSFAIGGSLFALATGLFWCGRVPALAATAGMKAGMVAFAVPVFAYHSYFAPNCCTLSTMLLVNGICGLGVGVLLSIEIRPAADPAQCLSIVCQRRGLYLRDARLHFVWPDGACRHGGGVLLATAPVAIYRHAHA